MELGAAKYVRIPKKKYRKKWKFSGAKRLKILPFENGTVHMNRASFKWYENRALRARKFLFFALFFMRKTYIFCASEFEMTFAT